ncbi:putative glycosyltransferase EpsF [bioreactor metagenome]|uniref:Putative glycosyltransferase EpsF n=1 Tax=bioreactor metagenome TaxID=1076179 RepID=A0A645GF72_9ZZZZ
MLNRRILEQGLEGNVLLTGERCDVPALLSAFDLFVLPSWFEGLGIALIEAQANGLPCYASDRIPRDTNVISCEPLPPDRADLWAERMIYAKPASSRELNRNAFISKGYDIESAASTLMNEYLEISKR